MNSKLYKDIQQLLENVPSARERRNRHKVIMHLLFHFVTNGHVIEDRLKNFIDEYNTCVRYIQMIQKDNVELRGKDYTDSKVLVQSHNIGIGYEVGYYKDIKN